MSRPTLGKYPSISQGPVLQSNDPTEAKNALISATESDLVLVQTRLARDCELLGVLLIHAGSIFRLLHRQEIFGLPSSRPMSPTKSQAPDATGTSLLVKKQYNFFELHSGISMPKLVSWGSVEYRKPAMAEITDGYDRSG